MDVFPKFIIEDGNLILGKVTYHKELVTDPEKVKGGGWYRYHQPTNTFTFYESSHEYGKAKVEDIRECICRGNVYTNTYLIDSIASNHNFNYYSGTQTIDLP